VVTAHGYDVTTTASRASDNDELFAYASRFVAVSEFIASQLVALGAPEEKIDVRPIGIRVPDAVSAAPRSDSTILFVGRLVEKKGCADLLHAVASLPLSSKIKVRIAGTGPLRTELESLAGTLRVNAEFLGALDPGEVEQEMRQAAVLCVPSKRASNGDAEGFGMVFLEAAAAATPAVSYRSGGTAEAIVNEETGLLAQEGQVQDLAIAIDRVLRDPGLARRLGSNGRKRVARDFDIVGCTRQLEKTYDYVAATWGLGA
jgi:colanic acid/amylovoran biosynthesis glycosyltransferase